MLFFLFVHVIPTFYMVNLSTVAQATYTESIVAEYDSSEDVKLYRRLPYPCLRIPVQISRE